MLGIVALALTAGASIAPSLRPPVALASEGLVHSWVLDEDSGSAVGFAVAVPTGTSPDLLPGSHVLDPGADAAPAERRAALEAAERQRAWVAAGTVPGADGPHAPLARTALLDLHTATHSPDGEVQAPQAAPTGAWRYIWPRDAAFAAVALARTGHADDAVAVLSFFDGVEVTPQGYHARYRPDGSVAGDGRAPQLDGAGWLLWATAEVTAAAPPTEVEDVRRRLADVTAVAGDLLMTATSAPDRLPPPSSDYWELPETRLTLGTAMPVLTGLDALATLHEGAGRAAEGAAARTRLGEVRDAVVHVFGPTWPREAGGRHQDAALAMALPPFQDAALPGAEAAWRLSARGMARPAGGLAPGQEWGESDYSWTPQTALYALAAASLGDDAQAHDRLDWLASHTTLTGSIPEKVGPDGGSAQVAPLIWSTSLVLLTLAELD
ncbi:Glucoamylase [Serinibacter arcticus]|uniref:Glucoamylase n=1 Tax=Serinibacter arcticus TaxID=1655435 RepID=A0A4Z1E8F2_9MICO|nr:Glucoamylase [Serinibacter arcticus]